MVERQPNRPTDAEVRGAISRIWADDYMVCPSNESEATPVMFFGPFSVHILKTIVTPSRKPYFDGIQKLKDRNTLSREQEAEGVNPDESFWMFIDRKARERSKPDSEH